MVILETRQTDDQSGLSNLYILEVAVKYVMLHWLISMTGLCTTWTLNSKITIWTNSGRNIIVFFQISRKESVETLTWCLKWQHSPQKVTLFTRTELWNRWQSKNTKGKHLFHAATVFWLTVRKTWPLKDATFNQWELEHCVFCCVDLCASFWWTIQTVSSLPL